MFGIAGTAELSTFCPGTGTWNRLQDGKNVIRAKGLELIKSKGGPIVLRNRVLRFRYDDALRLLAGP